MKNRKRALPIGFAVVGMLVVLAGLGIISGLWSKNLVVNGTVETGDLQVDFTQDTTGVGDDLCTSFNPLFPCTHVRKDVGKFECLVDEQDHQIVNFRVINAYPSYEADCEYHFANTGSIPFNVIGAVITGGGALTGCSGDLDPNVAVLVECDQMTIKYFDNIGMQIDPGEEQSGSLKIHVKQAAAQSDCIAESTDIPGGGPPAVVVSNIKCNEDTQVTYEFAVKICVAQWNEEATYEQCVLSAQHEGPESILLYTGNASIAGNTFEPASTLNSLEAHYEGLGYFVDNTSTWPASLSSYSMVYIHGPGNTDDSGAAFFTAAQKAALSAYLAAGGRVVVAGEHGGVPGTNTVNDLLAAISGDISQNGDLATPDGDVCAPMTDITANGATAGVTAIDPSATSSLTVGGSAVSLARVDALPYSCGFGVSNGATYLARDGRLVVLGDTNTLDDYGFSDPLGDGNNVDLATALANY